MSTASLRIPALVVSGFLGSGKTSLVRYLLRDAQERGIRVAFVSNEVGALGIDRALLGRGGEAFVELEGGCVCCELSDDLVETLQTLHDEVEPERIVVETSGAALPWDTQLNFWRAPVSSWIGDDAALVVVNAEQLAERRDLEGTFTDQVSSADLLVLNKIDLVAPEALDECEALLREIEPEAPIVRARHGEVPVDLLFPPDAGRVDRSGPAPAARPHDHEHFETEVWECPDGIEIDALEAALEETRLLRAKGFVRTAEGPRLVQLVGRRLEITEPEIDVDPALFGKIVRIRRSQSGERTHHHA